MAATTTSFVGFYYYEEKELTPVGPLVRECECAKEYGTRGIKGELG
jgi:putative methionine-R-sulfoxide reductase with GAF domain